MLETIKNILGIGPQADYAALLAEGAQIVDVRTRGEYSGGNIKGSLNIPLDTLASNVAKLDKSKPVITCCASGMRSASAKAILRSHGFRVYNGGGWASLAAKIGKR